MNTPKNSVIPFPAPLCPVWDGSSIYAGDGISTDFYGGLLAGHGPSGITATRSGMYPSVTAVTRAAILAILQPLVGTPSFPEPGQPIERNHPEISMPVYAPVVGGDNYQIALGSTKLQRWLRVKQWAMSGSITGGGAEVDFGGTIDPDLSSSSTEDQLIRYFEAKGSLYFLSLTNNLTATASGGISSGAIAIPVFNLFGFSQLRGINDDAGVIYEFNFCNHLARQDSNLLAAKRWYPSLAGSIIFSYPISTSAAGDTTTDIFLIVALSTSQTLEGNYTVSADTDLVLPVKQFSIIVDGEMLSLNGIASVLTLATTTHIGSPPTRTASAVDASLNDIAIAPSKYLTYGGSFDEDSGNYGSGLI